MEVNRKNYELCYGERKSISIKRNSKKTFMINLTDSMKVSMESHTSLTVRQRVMIYFQMI